MSPATTSTVSTPAPSAPWPSSPKPPSNWPRRRPEWAVIAAAFTGLDEAVAAIRDLQNRPYAPLGLHILNPAAARHTAARHTNRDSLPAGYGPVAIAIIGGRPASLQRRLTDASVLWLDTAAALHVARDDAPGLIAALNDLPAASRPPANYLRPRQCPPGRPALT